jgi:hypothetical protein
MASSKFRAIARLWALALAASALLAAAGERWPQPLQPRADLALALVLVPPLLLAAWLLLRPDPSVGSGESEGSERESC